jgi:ABC-2 type transport system ATP-binding protein
MIEASGLTRRFGAVVAVDEICLQVPDGAILALLGPNGAGKTTTVRMLAGLLAPSGGDATVAGCNVRSQPAAVRARVGLVTDVPGLYEQMTLPAYLDFIGQVYGVGADRRRQRIDELLAFFDLSDHRSDRMVGFSRGMKQKVALARALIHEPAVLFLDEPTSGLDPLASRAVRDLIVGLRDARRSIVLCTHDLDEAERLADEVAIIHHGKIVVSDSPAALRASAYPDTRVQVVLAAPCPGAVPVLEEMAGVASALLRSECQDGEPVWTVEYRTTQPMLTNPDVIAQLIALGARVVSVTCETQTLEDVYAAVIGGERPGRVATSPVE